MADFRGMYTNSFSILPTDSAFGVRSQETFTSPPWGHAAGLSVFLGIQLREQNPGPISAIIAPRLLSFLPLFFPLTLGLSVQNPLGFILLGQVCHYLILLSLSFVIEMSSALYSCSGLQFLPLFQSYHSYF